MAPAALVPEVYLPARHGSLQAELLAAARRHGRVAYPLRAGRDALEQELRAGRPVLVLQNFGSSGEPIWHYAVVIGYEPGHVLLRSGVVERQRLPDGRFDGTWSRAAQWAFVVLRPGELPASGEARAYAEAAGEFETTASAPVAAVAYRAGLERWPDEPALWFGLGNVRTRLADPAGAEIAFRTALEVAPGFVAARNNLAELLAARGCVAAARREIDRAAADAADGALAADIEATRREIEALPPGPGRSDCPEP